MTEVSAGDNAAAGVPMSNPDMLLTLHEQKDGHSVTWAELDDGRILRTGGGFFYSEDGGLSWSEHFLPKDEKGEDMVGGSLSLVKLSGGSIGLAHITNPPDLNNNYGRRAEFRRSEDGGRTWSKPIAISPPGLSVNALQDVLLRTSSGRLIYPTYMGIGQGSFRHENAPFVGGYVNGHFVSTDAHFFDPHFGASVVFYSDDEGQTWQRNHDGEIFILLQKDTAREDTYEPSVTEVTPGKLLMMFRTRLGRYFQSWSSDNGETWTRPQPTQLAGVQAPCQVRTFRDTGHLLCVFTQHSEDEIRRGYIRQRLSSAVSRNGGGVWEYFQNVESILKGTHVEPGPIRYVRPEQCRSMGELPAPENDARYCAALPENYGRWSYPSVLVLNDRVLISHTYSTWRTETGLATKEEAEHNSRLKVLPMSWFYGGQDPAVQSPVLDKLTKLAPKP